MAKLREKADVEANVLHNDLSININPLSGACTLATASTNQDARKSRRPGQQVSLSGLGDDFASVALPTNLFDLKLFLNSLHVSKIF